MDHTYDTIHGQIGVWVVYYYGQGLTATSIHERAEYAIQAHETGDHIAFWPVGKTLADAVAWYESTKPTKPEPEDKERTQADAESRIGNIIPVALGVGFAYNIVADDEYRLPCDGRYVSRNDFPELFKVLGYRFGGEETAHEFGLPRIEA